MSQPRPSLNDPRQFPKAPRKLLDPRLAGGVPATPLYGSHQRRQIPSPVWIIGGAILVGISLFFLSPLKVLIGALILVQLILLRSSRRTRPHKINEQDLRDRMRPRPRRFWIVGVIALLTLSYFLNSPLLLLAAMLVTAIAFIPEIWYLIALRGVFFRRTLSAKRARFGEDFFVTYQFENRKIMPVPWLQMEDELADQLEMHAGGTFVSYKPLRQLFIASFSLWLFQRVKRRYRLTALARGVWPFGPTFIRAGDPFGFLENEEPADNEGGENSIVVLPIVAPLTTFGLPSKYPFGELNTRRQTLEDPSQVVGARDYQPGDPIRRVHWKATARSTTLQSKVYPPTTTNTLVIFLDINTTDNPSMGIRAANLELGIAAAASVASWATDHRFAVGLVSNSLPSADSDQAIMTFEDAQASMRLPPSHHPEQLPRLLEALARMQPYFGANMDNLLAREQMKLPMGATVIYISAAAALHPSTLRKLEQFKRHGHTVALLLTGNEPIAASGLLTYRLGGEEAWNDLAEFARSQFRSGPAGAPHEPGPDDGVGRAERRGDAGDHRAAHQPRHEPAFTVG